LGPPKYKARVPTAQYSAQPYAICYTRRACSLHCCLIHSNGKEENFDEWIIFPA